MHLQFAEIELICLREFIYLTRRSFKYIQLILFMYLRSLDNYHRSCLLRAAYCLARYVDDILDGDRKVKINPKQYVENLIEQIKNEHFRLNDPMSHLAKYIMEQIDHLGCSGDDPRGEVLSLFRHMIFDWDRARQRLTYDAATLYEHHIRTLTYAQNLTLIIAGSRLRGNDVLDLIKAQSHLYTLRDLKNDLSKGIINIPAEVLNAAKLPGDQPSFTESILINREIRKWMRTEYDRGKHHLFKFTTLLPGLKDRPARKIFKPLTRGLRLLVLRLERRLDHEFPIE